MQTNFKHFNPHFTVSWQCNGFPLTTVTDHFKKMLDVKSYKTLDFKLFVQLTSHSSLDVRNFIVKGLGAVQSCPGLISPLDLKMAASQPRHRKWVHMSALLGDALAF